MLGSANVSSGAIAQSQTIQSTPMIQAASAVVLASNAPAATDTPITHKNTGIVESKVRKYYAKNPILAQISRCESEFRQFDNEGNVIRGRVDHDDIGVMQINLRYNGDTAKKLGYDIYTLDGNLAFGQWLYDQQGTDPWSASQPCWDN